MNPFDNVIVNVEKVFNMNISAEKMYSLKVNHDPDDDSLCGSLCNALENTVIKFDKITEQSIIFRAWRYDTITGCVISPPTTTRITINGVSNRVSDDRNYGIHDFNVILDADLISDTFEMFEMYPSYSNQLPQPIPLINCIETKKFDKSAFCVHGIYNVRIISPQNVMLFHDDTILLEVYEDRLLFDGTTIGIDDDNECYIVRLYTVSEYSHS